MQSQKATASYRITDQALIDNFVQNKENTFLVSFPRTGSHWLRMMIELYFERPTLVRTFYYPNKNNFILLHTHDMDLTVKRSNVIYLYRNPVDTVFSQLKYNQEDIDNTERIMFWSIEYAKHMANWLINNNSIKKITLIKYELLISDLHQEFNKVCAHFGETLNSETLNLTASKVTKTEVKKKTSHDLQVVKISTSYSEKRNYFKKTYSELILNTFFAQNDSLKAYFS